VVELNSRGCLWCCRYESSQGEVGGAWRRRLPCEQRYFGQGHLSHCRSLISVKFGPMLHEYFRPCYNIIQEKPNLSSHFGEA
jgi:hypothetical protein